MRPHTSVGVYALCTFFIFGLGIAFFFNRNFPVLAVASESSVGTWISGVLLSCCASANLIISIHRGWYPWVLFTSFFFLLAADEHFMFHERLKDWIIFSNSKSIIIIGELPVMAGALIGGWVSWILWSRLGKFCRTLLLGAVFFGTASVILDVVGSAALWEECLKLMAELAIACALLVEGSVVPKTAQNGVERNHN